MSKDKERSIKDKVKAVAKEQERAFNDVWFGLILERFLVRLSRSKHSDKFIFKGGMLLARYLTIGRETRDLDFLLRNIEVNQQQVTEHLSDICSEEVNDGFSFEVVKIGSLEHPALTKSVFEVSIMAVLGATKTRFHIDIGFDDPVEAEVKEIDLLRTAKSSVFEESISLHVYPPEYIFAEKYETVLTRADSNSRMKDFHDLWSFVQNDAVLDVEKLKIAIEITLDHRGVEIRPISLMKNSDQDQIHKLWDRYVNASSIEGGILPDSIDTLIRIVNNWLREKNVMQ